MKKPTLQEIAKQLNVSRITVSKVINNRPGVSEDTKRKVIHKLLECGYKKISADLLSLLEENNTEEVRCIAVVAVAPEFSEFWLKIIQSIANALSETGYDCINSFLAKNENNKLVLPKIIDSKRVSGVIVINVYDDAVIQALSLTGIPTVFLDTTPKMFDETVKGDVVLLEGSRSIAEITSHIIASGRTEIGFIGDITYSQTILERWQGYKKAMADNGLPVNGKFCFTSSSYGHFYYMEEIENFLSEVKDMPPAFVCANDFIAFMLIDYLKKRGYRVPDDIAVSGYDDIREKITSESRLTTVTINTSSLGRRLVKQVLMRIETPGMPNEIIYIEPNVVYRDSTRF